MYKTNPPDDTARACGCEAASYRHRVRAARSPLSREPLPPEVMAEGDPR
jgi:hypothetical protein